MKILVCISKTPDTTTKISFVENNTKFNSDKVQFIINPYDEWYALVRAIELKEKGLAQQVTIINVGGADSDPIIRKALAIGGDDAVRIAPKTLLTLEECMEYIQHDECIEVTPKNIRMRKVILNEEDRKRVQKQMSAEGVA